MKDRSLALILGLLIAVAGVFVGGNLAHRYDTEVAADGLVVRTNQLSGDVVACDHKRCWRVIDERTPIANTAPF